MEFELQKSDGHARAGEITTSHGRIETPAFMPCGTTGAVKGVRWSELEELGYTLVLMNALHLYLRPDVDIVRQMGGIQKFTGWSGSILTDSGGYQFFSLKGLYRISDDGVRFQSPYDGSPHEFTPESLIDIQVALGSDIIMPLDECPPGDSTREKVIVAGERTLSWLERAKERFRCIGDRNQSLFGIIQGGIFIDLRKEYATRSAEMNLDGYAIGGISVGEDRAEGEAIVETIAPDLPENKPRYLMGVGLPGQILHGIANGIDMFDCVLPTRMGRNGTVFTSAGRMNMSNAKYKTDNQPLDSGCDCPTCRGFSRAYLAHLHKIKDPGVLGLLSIHNLAYYRKIMRDAKTAILSGNFNEWKSETENRWVSDESS